MAITTTHYRFAVGAFLVYDVTNIYSFLSLKDWLDKIREYSDPNVIIALVANKSDLVEEDDRKKNYGKFSMNVSDVLDTDGDQGNRHRKRHDDGNVVQQYIA